MIGCEQTGAPDCGLSWRTFGIAFAVHVALFLFFWGMGIINFRKPDVIIPIDMTIVPPWAQQTDDPEPDPNPPPPEVKQEVKPPPKAPEPEKVEVKPNVEAVEKVVEKKKPEKVDLKKNAKLVKKPPKPQPPPKSLKDTAKLTPAKPLERPPDLKIPDNMKKFGKGTAHDKPLPNIDMKKMLDQGYRYGAKNQIATSEEQRCVSLIKQAILREWNKESFKWYNGLKPIEVEFHLGSGGVVQNFKIRSGSGDADVDRTAVSALNRLKGQKIYGLTAQFLEQFPELAIVMEPTQGH